MIGKLKTRTEFKASAVQAARAVGTARPDRLSAVLGWFGGWPSSSWAVCRCFCACRSGSRHLPLRRLRSRTLMPRRRPHRDVFDNNLPGVIWLHAGSAGGFVGWRPEMLHLADLVFFSVDVLLLVRWVPSRARVWLAAAFYAFYLFIPETCPCQRDIWMLLPALVGLTLRQQQVRRLSLPLASAPTAVVWGRPGRAVLGSGSLDQARSCSRRRSPAGLSDCCWFAGRRRRAPAGR